MKTLPAGTFSWRTPVEEERAALRRRKRVILLCAVAFALGFNLCAWLGVFLIF